MGLREEIQKRIEKKQEEVRELELRIREAHAYIQGLQDTIKILPRDAASSEPSIRPGSGLSKAREVLREKGEPLHIAALLTAMGREVTKESRAGLSGQLAAYVRRNEVFTRTGPNVFGLVEFGRTAPPRSSEPPRGFGQMEEEEEDLAAKPA